MTRFKPKGKFYFEQVRDGKVIDRWEADNGVTDFGIDKLLDIMFNADTQITLWYCGLISNSGFSALAAGDLSGSHAGWTESTAYSNATRPQWDPAAASSKVVANGTAMAFLINASATLKGAFIISNSTKGGSTGVLWCTALFNADKSVVNGDTLNVVYTVTGSDET